MKASFPLCTGFRVLFIYRATQTLLMRWAYTGKIARKDAIGLTVPASYPSIPAPNPGRDVILSLPCCWGHMEPQPLCQQHFCLRSSTALTDIPAGPLAVFSMYIALAASHKELHEKRFNRFHFLSCFLKISPARDTTAKISGRTLPGRWHRLVPSEEKWSPGDWNFPLVSVSKQQQKSKVTRVQLSLVCKF